MKQRKTVFILVALLAVLFVSYFLIEKMQDNDEEVVIEEAIEITRMGELVSMRYHSDSEELSFVKEEDVWYYEADKELDLDQTLVGTMENIWKTIDGERQLENPDALSDYGLEEAQYTIYLEDADGMTTTVYIGNDVNGNYYLTLDEKETIYTVSSSVVDAMEFDVENLVEVQEETTEDEDVADETTDTEDVEAE